MPKLNPDGTPTNQYQQSIYTKIIYDPNKISDQEFIDKGHWKE